MRSWVVVSHDNQKGPTEIVQWESPIPLIVCYEKGSGSSQIIHAINACKAPRELVKHKFLSLSLKILIHGMVEAALTNRLMDK